MIFSRLFSTLSLSLLLSIMLGGCSSLGLMQDSGITTPSSKDGYAITAPAPAASPREPVVAMPTGGVPPTAVPVGGVKVALLLPLSGKSAPLGQAMANAAQLAVFDLGAKGFELMPRDTKGTTKGAVDAAKDAVASGAGLIVGPLFAADVAAVKPVIQPTGVSMLALSTDVSLAEAGAYVMGFAPAPQVERVVSYAASKGVKNYVAVVPTGPYGKLVIEAFEEAVRANGGELLAQTSPTNIAELAAHKDKADAIFLPFGGVTLRTIATQLAGAGFEKERVRLLGTGLWDEEQIAQGIPLLNGGWFAAPDVAAREKFMKAYKDVYGAAPPRLATLAYDATALAAVMARNNMPFDRASLTSPSGFAGLDGIFRLLPGGQIERGLAVLEASDTDNRVIDPSPSAFSRR